jgi:hypothetical protein
MSNSNNSNTNNSNTNNSNTNNSNTNNSNTNYSETDSNVSNSNNSNVEVVFGKKMSVKPKVRFSTRRHVRKTNKSNNAVQSRKGYKKVKKTEIPKNINAENLEILKNSIKRFTYTKKERKQVIQIILEYLKELKESEEKNFLTEEQIKFIQDDLLGDLKK